MMLQLHHFLVPLLLLFSTTSIRAQFIDEEECLDCISQGCQYCATQGYDANSGASALYCECDADAVGTCLTTEAQCEIDIGQILGAAAWLLLLPCLCGCACIAGCVYLCCRNSNGTHSTSNAGGNYYMQEADPNKMHHAMVGTEPYSNHTYSQQQQNYHNQANNAAPASDRPFSQALSK